ncbi:uncharacterized protein BP01DRAFT_199413 [Aspergillus saccharolyticus JOP 1030-1]|uniref:Uncharacterized protein n=1 Tax=Aspergillus saccharolyticus JOP 1030-1 TaxID=1450539 RepID=A0A318ZMG0_9EURO|nr:hypothetical protein BP01DRAFT_199413 [Aspergillus saccharolyticus JOP 1030-1]PYH47865.1 hypothetical protein BP01DRAFT_199413 [Aspergillus saccharolyticus JOP 1030-1]
MGPWAFFPFFFSFSPSFWWFESGSIVVGLSARKCRRCGKERAFGNWLPLSVPEPGWVSSLRAGSFSGSGVLLCWFWGVFVVLLSYLCAGLQIQLHSFIAG